MMNTGAGLIDLHCHTDYSDGTFSPSEVAEMALRAGLRALAITDHDTMEGFLSLGEVPGLELVPGIERKAWWEGVELHILGYGGDWERLRRFPQVEHAREARNAAMVEKLRAGGIDISLPELKSMKKGVVGRPHMARLLMEKGYFPTVQQAFDEWLGEGKPFYVPSLQESVQEVAAELRSSGARVVLAHPLEYKLSPEDLRRLAAFCRDSGVQGMEVFYSGYMAAESAALAALAEQFGLCLTGGSDFHGPRRSERVLGKPQVPYVLLEKLMALAP